MPGSITAAPDMVRVCSRCGAPMAGGTVDEAAIIRGAIERLTPADIRQGVGRVAEAELARDVRNRLVDLLTRLSPKVSS